jgi:hypothetical protein
MRKPRDITPISTVKKLDEEMRTHMRRLKAAVSYRALEPRMVFDAAAIETAAHAIDGVHITAGAHNASESSTIMDVAAALAAATAPVGEPAHVFIFIDAGVGNTTVLADAVSLQGQIVILDQNRDGLTQIAEVLSHNSNVDAVYVVSHGQSGLLQLGSTQVTSSSIANEHAAALTTIRGSLAADADIFLFGCNVAGDAHGRAFVDALAEATGADIAASDDLTGDAALGGDWNLEYHVGFTAEYSSLSDKLQAEFHELLNITVNNGDGAYLVSADKGIYSVDVVTGRATLITTVPAAVGGVTVGSPINSLAVDQVNGLIYYCDSNAVTTNVALFAYDFINNTPTTVPGRASWWVSVASGVAQQHSTMVHYTWASKISSSLVPLPEPTNRYMHSHSLVEAAP